MINSKALLTLCCISLCLPATAFASDPQSKTSPKKESKEGWFYGAFTSYAASPYRDHKKVFRIFPAIGYKSEKFSLTGPRASLQVWKHESIKTELTLQYQSYGYDPEDSDYLSGMKRSGSLFAGISASKKLGKWTHNIGYQKDIQGRSKGGDLKVSTSYFHNMGPLFITPKLTLSYLDDKLSNYYYGVEDSESRANRAAYSPSDAWNPSLGVTLATPIFLGGFTRLTIENHWLDSTITDSPIIDDKHYWQMSLMFTRFF